MITTIGITIIIILLIGGSAYVFRDFLKEFGLIGSMLLISGVFTNIITICFVFNNIIYMLNNKGSIYDIFTFQVIKGLLLTIFFIRNINVRNKS